MRKHRRLCFRYMDSTIPLLPSSEISSFELSSVNVHAGLCQTGSETSKTGFLTSRPIYHYHFYQIFYLERDINGTVSSGKFNRTRFPPVLCREIICCFRGYALIVVAQPFKLICLQPRVGLSKCIQHYKNI